MFLSCCRPKLKGKIELAGQGFEPCGDVYCIPKDVVILGDHVALVNADTKLDALVRRRRCISLCHAILHFSRAAQCVYYADKFRQHAIAGIFDGTTVMLADLWVDQLDEMRLEAFERALFVGAHQARVARYIGGEDRGKTAGRGHGCGSPPCNRLSVGEIIHDKSRVAGLAATTQSGANGLSVSTPRGRNGANSGS